MSIKAIAGVGVVMSVAVTSFTIYLGLQENVYGKSAVRANPAVVFPSRVAGFAPLSREALCAPEIGGQRTPTTAVVGSGMCTSSKSTTTTASR